MTRIRYFSDIDGEAVALSNVRGMKNDIFRARFPNVRGIRDDSFTMRVGWDDVGKRDLPVTRIIDYKAFPSKHECNAKCMNGSVRGTCECKCGGLNHGRGMFSRLIRN